LAGREVKPLILEIVEKLAENGFGESLDRSLDDCLKLMACHGAIRAHQALTAEQMQGLLEQMDSCKNSAHCPHGRPTWIEWTGRDLEKLFNRIV
jgi:DNA mismatch repair protein MutL